MTKPLAAVVAAATVLTLTVAIVFLTSSANALGGSSTTLAVMYGASTAVCGIVAGQSTQNVQCWTSGRSTPVTVYPEVSFDFIAGGIDVLCGVRSGGFALLCWNPNFTPKRLYLNYTTPLSSLTIGDTQICGLTNGSTRNALCWRGGAISNQQNGPSDSSEEFQSISSGSGFTCGVVKSSNRVSCWGATPIASDLETQFQNESMADINAGGSFACGINTTGFVICKGSNENGELEVPFNSAYEYSGLTLGLNHSCAIRRVNQTVVCWGRNGAVSSSVVAGVPFESIVSGPDFTCGLRTSNFSVVCWGPGWTNNNNSYPQAAELPLPKILPAPCVNSNCDECGVYPLYQSLCSGDRKICKPCDLPSSFPPSSPPQNPPPPQNPERSKRLRRGLLVFSIVGSVGGFAGICTILYCLWTGVCFGKKKIHNSVQPTITAANPQQQSSSGPLSRSSTLRRQGSRLMRRQRSGTSSKHADRAEEFTFPDLVAATNNFSLENKIGAGSFGVVYKGKLPDGREVAIKRGETGPKTKIFQEKESAFQSELSFLSRLHHKHLVRLVGFCEEGEERLLVYEFMKNGALYDHLHDKNNVEKSSNIVNSWKIRIKVALDAARGIEYLHNYAVPPIIHRDIKSSNILLDANWTARVSDFGLSLMGPDSDRDYSRPMNKAGTVGYIDPEYYGLNVLTTKSDVYGLGIVLLELLTGKRAIFKANGGEGAPMSLVDYALPAIMAGELTKILDPRVGLPEPNEAEAVELVAYTAMHCVNLEGKDRPSMTDIVVNLERALNHCEDSHGSISSGQISIVSE
ncbi:putative serine/threonine-protein kinase-like protein CCR3 [Ipomoea triloba]|uniref:putative serine/threonine-protein kinase-like protein CCR3 n=1 Tax=Ipomoea triloba TaxID=35885 RepID=UPI00125DC944|nr:putative serine/threonine-protein kinase-like protein CCR3 [Ipomoea triloba]